MTIGTKDDGNCHGLNEQYLEKSVFQRHAKVSSIKIIWCSSGCIRMAAENYWD